MQTGPHRAIWGVSHLFLITDTALPGLNANSRWILRRWLVVIGCSFYFTYTAMVMLVHHGCAAT